MTRMLYLKPKSWLLRQGLTWDLVVCSSWRRVKGGARDTEVEEGREEIRVAEPVSKVVRGLEDEVDGFMSRIRGILLSMEGLLGELHN